MSLKSLSQINLGQYTLPTSDGSNGQVLQTNGSGTVTFATIPNKFLSGLSFDTSTGVLTATVSGGSNVTVDLDNRYLELTGGTLTGNLQINTASTNSVGNGIVLNRPAAGTHYHGLHLSTNGTCNWSVGQNSNDSFQIYEEGLNSKTRFTIAQGGNATFSGGIAGQTLTLSGGSGNVPMYVRTDSTVAYIQIQNSSTQYGGTSNGLTVGNNGTAAYIWNREQASLYLGTNDTTALHLDNSQRAIFAQNVSVPQTKKILFDGINGHTYLAEESDSNLKVYVGGTERFNFSGGTNYSQQALTVAGHIMTSSASYLIASRKFSAINSSGTMLTADDGSSGLLIADSGNATFTGTVGIKTPNSYTPNANADELVVGSGVGNQGITIYSGDSNSGAIYFADDLDEEGAGDSPAGNRDGIIRYEHNNSRFSVRTGGNQTALTISNSLFQSEGSIVQNHSSSSRTVTVSSGSDIRGSNHLLLQADASYLKLAASNNNIYYDTGTHFFRNGAGSSNYVTFSSTDATIKLRTKVQNSNGIILSDSSDSGTSRTTFKSYTSGGNAQTLIKGGNYIHTVKYETTWNDFNYALLTSSYNTSDSKFRLNKSDSSGGVDSYTEISTGTSIFAGDVDFDGHITLTGNSKNIVLDYGNEIRTKDSGGTQRTVLRAASNKLQYGWSYPGEVEFMGGGSYTPRITINTDGSTTFAGDVLLGDGQKAKFGDNPDLQIYHNGSHSFIQDVGAGDLRLLGSSIKLQSTTEENMLVATPDGSVALYHDNSVRFETGAAGSQVTGNFYLFSGSYIHFDNGVSNNYAIRKTSTKLQFKTGGSFEFLSGNATFAGSIHLDNDSAQLQFGDDNDMQIFHNGANGEINIGTGSFTIDSAGDITLDAAGNDIRFFKSGVEYGKFKSDSNDFAIFSSVENKDIIFRGNDAGSTIDAMTLDMSDAGTAIFNNALYIPNHIIHVGDGDTKIGFNTDNSVEIRAGGNLQISADSSRSYLRFQGNAKLMTDSAGVIITGNISNSSGHFTVSSADDFNVDAAGQINLDADGGSIRLKDAGSTFGMLHNGSQDFQIWASTNNKDLVFKGYDDGTAFTALHLDMSDAGTAFFTGKIYGRDSGIIIDSISGPYGRIHGTSSIFLGGSSTSNVQLSAQLIPDADSTRSLGNSSRYWSNAYIDQITTTGDVNVGGNLNVTGDINSVSVTDLDVTDKTITVGKGQTASNSGSSGIIVERSDSTNPSLLWNQGTGRFDFNTGLTVTGQLHTTGSVYAKGSLFVVDTNGTNNHVQVRSNGTEGFLILSNGSNWGFIARGSVNDPRIGAYHGGVLKIEGFHSSDGSTGSNAVDLAQFDFANERFLVNGDIRINNYTGANTGGGGQTIYAGGLSIFENSGTDALFLGVKNASYANRGWSFKVTEVGVNSKLELREHGQTGTRLTIESGGNATFAGDITITGDTINTSNSDDYLEFDDDTTTFNPDTNVTTLTSVSGIALATNLNDGGGGNFTVSTGSTGTELLRITTSGNANFAGTISSKEISIKQQDDSGFNAGLTIERSANTQKVHIGMDGGAVNFNSPDGLSYKFRNNGTEKFTVDGSGNGTFAGHVKAPFFTTDGGRGFKQDSVAFVSTYSNGADANAANDIGKTANKWRDAYFSGAVNAGSFVKSGGTSSQFLMADGSVSTGGGGNDNLGNHTATQALNMAGSNITNAGSVQVGGELDFINNGDKYMDVFTLANGNTFNIRHHNPTGNLFETAFKTKANGETELYHNGSVSIKTRSDGFQAKAFMDSDNTARFINPASSHAASLAGRVDINTTSDAKMRFYTPSTDSSDWGYIEFYKRDGNRASYFGINGSGNPTWAVHDGSPYIQLNDSGNYVEVGATNIRASSFVDKDSTAYYGDFGNTGTSVNVAGSINLLDNKMLLWGGNSIVKHTGSATEIGDNSSGSVLTIASGDADFTGNVEMQSGNSVGKFAVMSTGVHGSYDFYNNGTSYFNGQVTIDATCLFSDNEQLKFGGSADFLIYHNSTTNVNHVSSQLDRQLSINANIIQLTNQANSSTYLKLESDKATLNTGLNVGGSVGQRIYAKNYSSLNTTGQAVAGLLAGSNGASASFVFETAGGGSGGYQRVVFSCINASGTWNVSEDINEGGDRFDITSSGNGSTVTFTFKARSSTQHYSPKVNIKAFGHSINETYF